MTNMKLSIINSESRLALRELRVSSFEFCWIFVVYFSFAIFTRCLFMRDLRFYACCTSQVSRSICLATNCNQFCMRLTRVSVPGARCFLIDSQRKFMTDRPIETFSRNVHDDRDNDRKYISLFIILNGKISVSSSINNITDDYYYSR